MPIVIALGLEPPPDAETPATQLVTLRDPIGTAVVPMQGTPPGETEPVLIGRELHLYDPATNTLLKWRMTLESAADLGKKLGGTQLITAPASMAAAAKRGPVPPRPPRG